MVGGKASKQAGGCLKGARLNLCLYLRSQERGEDPSALLLQQHLSSQGRGIDCEQQPGHPPAPASLGGLCAREAKPGVRGKEDEDVEAEHTSEAESPALSLQRGEAALSEQRGAVRAADRSLSRCRWQMQSVPM